MILCYVTNFISLRNYKGFRMTALTNAQRQAAHREKQATTIENLAASVAKLLAENDGLKAQLEAAKTQHEKQENASKAKIASLEKRLLNALEKSAKK